MGPDPNRVGLSPIRRWVMRTTRQLSITLPNEMADALAERVRSGQYASESEVIRDGLRTLFARDAAVEAWLHDEVATVYNALVADPSRGIMGGDLRARLSARDAGR
ncbi:MAG: ribbon-helix-helix domain-containing protein [Pedococcus sp.]